MNPFVIFYIESRNTGKELQEAGREKWGKAADVVKDLLLCSLCTRNVQTYVGRPTVRVHSKAISHTSGSYLAECRVQMFSASAGLRHTFQCQARHRTAQCIGSLRKAFTTTAVCSLQLLSEAGLGRGLLSPTCLCSASNTQ